MVGLNGKITGGGHPAHKAGVNAEPYAPCVTRKMTPEERKFYGLDPEKGEPKKMVKKVEKKKRGKRIDLKRLKELVAKGFSAKHIAAELAIDEATIWKRAKAHGLITKLQANEAKSFYPKTAEPDPEEPSDNNEFIFANVVPEDAEPEPKAEPEFPQDSEENEFRYLSPQWLNEIAIGLTAGAVKHPGETWRGIPPKEHAWRAVRHLVLWLMGDRTDDHLINASMRVMMAVETARGRD